MGDTIRNFLSASLENKVLSKWGVLLKEFAPEIAPGAIFFSF